MPADIRNFFGGKGSTSTPIRAKEKVKEDSKKKRGSKLAR
jgi:hypothetical protein